jgi:hypothetical protein
MALAVAHRIDGVVEGEGEHAAGAVLDVVDAQAGGDLGVVAPGGAVE